MTKATTRTMTGAEMVVQALKDQGVEVVFGYPGGAVLPIYDAIFQQNDIRHILVRHEQAAVHMAEGYARSTGRPGVVIVTSGPGATNAVTGLTDALMDSIPVVVLSGQVPTFMIGTDGFQEADTVGITRPCTKMNWLVKDTARLSGVIHQAFHVATHGRPGPVLVDIPKDVQFATADYTAKPDAAVAHYQPQVQGDSAAIERLVELMESAERPVFYTGGGVINSGPEASRCLRDLVAETGFPITSTLMGLGAYPASGKAWLGMLGMHGLYQANLAMHGCDLMINVGARFDDRITGRLNAFSPHSRKIQIDVDPSSINKNVPVHVPIIGDVAETLAAMIALWRARGSKTRAQAVAKWWRQIAEWRAVDCLRYAPSATTIKPQYALQRLEALTKHRDRYICTEVGQHQMWAAQWINTRHPRTFLTSGGLGAMGFGFPAAMGAQVAHPDKHVFCISGDGSIQMNIQDLITAVSDKLPVTVCILNNRYLGMVKQWQKMFFDRRYSEVDLVDNPDFAKVAEAYGAIGVRVTEKSEVRPTLEATMAERVKPTFIDFFIDRESDVFPMIPSGQSVKEMILNDAI